MSTAPSYTAAVVAESWIPLSSLSRYARGRLTLREDVWRLPDGRERVYPVLAVGVTVGVLAFVDDAHVLLVRQYRHLQQALSWELPGGGAHPADDDEFIERRVVPLAEAIHMALASDITESVSKVTLLQYALHASA